MDRDVLVPILKPAEQAFLSLERRRVWGASQLPQETQALTKPIRG